MYEVVNGLSVWESVDICIGLFIDFGYGFLLCVLVCVCIFVIDVECEFNWLNVDIYVCYILSCRCNVLSF